MTVIQLNRTFLKKPLYSIGILVAVILIMEGLSWSSIYQTKLAAMNRHGGLWPYMSLFLRSAVVPEISTVYVLMKLLNWHHTRFKIYCVNLELSAIGRYELRFLPTVLLSFFIFNPVTETIRFLFEQFPSYSLFDYWHGYIRGTFTWDIYLRYLIPILLIGYISVNISLASDYFHQRHQAQEETEAKAAETIQQMLALSSTFVPKPTVSSTFLAHLKGKNTHGELDFPVSDVYYFTVEDRFYYAEMTKGRYLVGKTLNDLETELDPGQFTRIKRDYIVNRQAVLTYAYWENGKYIVRLNTPDNHEIVVPRARMQEFKEWLQGGNSDAPTTPTGPFALMT